MKRPPGAPLIPDCRRNQLPHKTIGATANRRQDYPLPLWGANRVYLSEPVAVDRTISPPGHTKESADVENSDSKSPKDQPDSSPQPSRRDFLKLSAMGAIGAVGLPAIAGPLAKVGETGAVVGRENAMPGRIVLCHDPEMEGHVTTINAARVEEMVQRSVRILTDLSDTGAAFESLFPGVHAGSTFAIKVNCIGQTSSRWETTRGVVSGLSQMLGGTYDVGQVTIFDRDNPHNRGYNEANFIFNGNNPLIPSNNNASGSGHQPWPGYSLSRYILNCDYLINVPALKSHSDGNNMITVALKNHYGSCSPSSLCGNIPGMLALNADSQIKDKTGLVITCGIRGTYNGGPSTWPQTWNTFPEGSPNMLLVTTDPVTNEYWSRDLINAERTTHGWSDKTCPWVETASTAQYELGVSDPGAMTVLNYDSIGVGEASPPATRGTFLARNVPNPFSESTTLRFRLSDPGAVELRIVDVTGRSVRLLSESRFPAGYSELRWDGRDGRGRQMAAGVYFARLQAGAEISSRRIILAR